VDVETCIRLNPLSKRKSTDSKGYDLGCNQAHLAPPALAPDLTTNFVDDALFDLLIKTTLKK
jgi:hypothetical protein